VLVLAQAREYVRQPHVVLADRLAKRGHDLILVARSVDRPQALANKIAGETGRKVEVIAADLGKRNDLAKVEAVLRTERRITTLVNNAGVGSTAPVLQADVDKMSDMIALRARHRLRLRRRVAAGGGVSRPHRVGRRH
jgi:short-subunit dehydrogenase